MCRHIHAASLDIWSPLGSRVAVAAAKGKGRASLAGFGTKTVCGATAAAIARWPIVSKAGLVEAAERLNRTLQLSMLAGPKTKSRKHTNQKSLASSCSGACCIFVMASGGGSQALFVIFRQIAAEPFCWHRFTLSLSHRFAIENAACCSKLDRKA